jgi:hypothetical protein
MVAYWRLCGWRDGKFTGVVSPAYLKFATKEEGEVVAERYRKAYPDQQFVVLPFNREGYIIKE